VRSVSPLQLDAELHRPLVGDGEGAFPQGVFGAALALIGVLARGQVQRHGPRADEVIVPEGQLGGPLRLPRGVLDVEATGDGLAGGLVCDVDLDNGGTALGERERQMSENEQTDWRRSKSGHRMVLYRPTGARPLTV
jgi:hypothetical protein